MIVLFLYTAGMLWVYVAYFFLSNLLEKVVFVVPQEPKLCRHNGAGPSRSQCSMQCTESMTSWVWAAFPAWTVVMEGVSPWPASHCTAEMRHHWHWVAGWEQVHSFTIFKVYKLKSPANLPPYFSLTEKKIILCRHAFQFQIQRIFFSSHKYYMQNTWLFKALLLGKHNLEKVSYQVEVQ